MGSSHIRSRIIEVRRLETGHQVEQFDQVLHLESPCIQVYLYGGFTLIDPCDLHLLEGWRWNVKPHRRTAYVVYQGSTVSLRLHRVIVPGGHQVDHRNGIGWDNRRGNLRECNALGQARNQRPHLNKMYSGYKGVTYDPIKKLYRARIMVNGRSIGLGRFKSDEDAAKAYDAAARKYFKEFAVVNLS